MAGGTVQQRTGQTPSNVTGPCHALHLLLYTVEGVKCLSYIVLSLVSNGKNIFLICFSESMKVNTNPSKTKEWRQVEVEEDFKIGWKKFVLFKGDIPSKKI